jgi:hypothetical protein
MEINMEVLLRNIISKEEAEYRAKIMKGRVVVDDLNEGSYMIIKEDKNV